MLCCESLHVRQHQLLTHACLLHDIKVVLKAMGQRPGCAWLMQPYVPALAKMEYRFVSIGDVGSVDSKRSEYIVVTARGTTADGSIAFERFKKPQQWYRSGSERGRVRRRGH